MPHPAVDPAPRQVVRLGRVSDTRSVRWPTPWSLRTANASRVRLRIISAIGLAADHRGPERNFGSRGGSFGWWSAQVRGRHHRGLDDLMDVGAGQPGIGDHRQGPAD
jgi:hypothetical protein